MTKYIYENRIEPKDAAKMTWHPRTLYPYFKEADIRFADASRGSMTTSKKLIQHMHTYMNRYKKDENDICERVDAWIECFKESSGRNTERAPEQTVSDHSSVVSCHEEVSNQAQKSPVPPINTETQPIIAKEERKDHGQPHSRSKPQQPSYAQSGEEP